MSSDRGAPIVIVGTGLAGGNAAKTLRAEGFASDLVMVGNEPGFPFGRPPLSKTYLRGEESLTGWMVEHPDWYAKNNVELLRTTAVRIDTSARSVELSKGAPLSYSKLLIATGGQNRRLDVPGVDLPGVHQLRTVAECEVIKSAAKVNLSAVVVGMGFIGSEVAASLRQMGLRVTAVFPGGAPLDSVLGQEMGDVMAGIHREEGVTLIPRDQVVSFEGTDHVETATTKTGRRIECDLAIVAVGISPTVDLLAGSGIAVDNGVLVDAACRTSAADVFAAGDVANHLHPLFGRIRVEHYNNAEKQGAAAARSMLGSGEEYRYLHTFWSDQYAHKLEYVGHVRTWDKFVVRGSLERRQLVGFYLQAGTLRAAVGLNRGGDPELDEEGEMAKAGRLVTKGARPSPTSLADEAVDLSELSLD